MKKKSTGDNPSGMGPIFKPLKNPSLDPGVFDDRPRVRLEIGDGRCDTGEGHKARTLRSGSRPGKFDPVCGSHGLSLVSAPEVLTFVALAVDSGLVAGLLVFSHPGGGEWIEESVGIRIGFEVQNQFMDCTSSKVQLL